MKKITLLFTLTLCAGALNGMNQYDPGKIRGDMCILGKIEPDLNKHKRRTPDELATYYRNNPNAKKNIERLKEEIDKLTEEYNQRSEELEQTQQNK